MQKTHTWKIPQLEARSSGATVDTEIVGVFQDSSKKMSAPKENYEKVVVQLGKDGSFSAKAGTVQFVRFGGKKGASHVLFAGLGSAEALTEEKVRQLGGVLWQKLTAEKTKSANIQIDTFWTAKGTKEGVTQAGIARAFAEGLILGAYSFSKYKKSADPTVSPTKLTFVSRDKDFVTQLQSHLDQVFEMGEAVNIARDWSNEPSNFGTPEYYANEARRFAKQYGLKCTVLGEREAQREKMGLFLAVGRGSDREGRVVVLEYKPKNQKIAKTIAFVGKGVTFDSGGISIKPSLRMEEMKHDMTGAATLFGATLLAAKWQVPNRIVTILAFTENMPGGDALQPGNVITARNGKTVEIINTDAEGRLILADVLDYAQDYKPDAIVDVATLTGAVSIALGKLCCGIMGNSNTLVQKLRTSGDACGERIWQLPLYDEYFDDLKSDSADMKNSANDGLGGTIRGAIFLKQFIRPHTKWVHLDIAATAWGLSHLSYYPKKGASGSYVRTLARFAAEF